MNTSRAPAAATAQPAAVAAPPSRPATSACRVPGCGADLAREKTYAQRKRLCAQHMQEFAVLLEDGAYHRFCFSCGKMHPLQCFDGKHRNCRAALLKRRQQSSSDRRNASPTELADAAGALTTEPSAAELPLGAPAIQSLLRPAGSASSNGSGSSSLALVLAAHNSSPQLAGSAAAAPALNEESALELLLETELTAAGLHELLAATGASSGMSSSAAPDDAGCRGSWLSWELASAVVENSLSQPESVAAAPCLLQRGPLDISAGYGMSVGPPAAAAPGSNAAGPASALGAPPQLAATAAGAWRHPVAADTPGSMAGSTVQQMARLGHLQAQVAMLQAQMHSLRQQLAMWP